MARTQEPADETAAVTLTFAQIKELLGARETGITPDVLSQIMTRTAEMSATAMQKALKPENTDSPGLSIFSYPEGDKARPRPELPWQLLWNGDPIHLEQSASTWWELEGFLTLKPGSYTVSRRDGMPLRVSVAATYGNDGITVERMTVSWDCDKDVRNMVCPPYIMCYQMAHADQDRQDTFVEAMSQMLQIELADRKAKAKKVLVAA